MIARLFFFPQESNRVVFLRDNGNAWDGILYASIMDARAAENTSDRHAFNLTGFIKTQHLQPSRIFTFLSSFVFFFFLRWIFFSHRARDDWLTQLLVEEVSMIGWLISSSLRVVRVAVVSRWLILDSLWIFDAPCVPDRCLTWEFNLYCAVRRSWIRWFACLFTRVCWSDR